MDDAAEAKGLANEVDRVAVSPDMVCVVMKIRAHPTRGKCTLLTNIAAC